MIHSTALSMASKLTLRPVCPFEMRTIMAGMIRPMTPKVNRWMETLPTQTLCAACSNAATNSWPMMAR